MSLAALILAFFAALLVILACAVAEMRHPSSSRRYASQRECLEGLKRLGYRSLIEYRRSELWQETKSRYYQSDYPQRCLICNSRDFDLHHRSYARLGEEEMFDLVPLCRNHHDRIHEILDSSPGLCVKDTHDFLSHLVDHTRPVICGAEVSNPFILKTTPADSKINHVNTFKNEKKRNRAGKKWTAEEDAALLMQFHAGVPHDPLADRLGRGERAVEVRLFKLGCLSLGKSGPVKSRDVPTENH